MLILRRKQIILVGITYYIPDHPLLLNEFFWQTEDLVPDTPAVHKFLNYWKNNIDAVIKQVEISYGKSSVRNPGFYGTIQ